MLKLKIKKLNQDAKLPSYAHKGDAGMDIFSCIDETLLPNVSAITPVGTSKIAALSMMTPKILVPSTPLL